LGTRRTASTPASTKYLRVMSSMPLVVSTTLAPAGVRKTAASCFVFCCVLCSEGHVVNALGGQHNIGTCEEGVQQAWWHSRQWKHGNIDGREDTGGCPAL
jgi:hypothetical protein